MKFYLLFRVNFLSSKLVFHEIHVNLSRVNFQYLNFMERQFPIIRYLLPFEATREVKLSMFQYKTIHHILYTKSLLFKMRKEDLHAAPFACPAIDHTIAHLFTECMQATLFWKEFLDWASCMVNSRISLSKNEIVFGIINQDSTFCLAVNHLVIIGKYFLYVRCKCS